MDLIVEVIIICHERGRKMGTRRLYMSSEVLQSHEVESCFIHETKNDCHYEETPGCCALETEYCYLV